VLSSLLEVQRQTHVPPWHVFGFEEGHLAACNTAALSPAMLPLRESGEGGGGGQLRSNVIVANFWDEICGLVFFM
jgi:hypothetical protein